MQEGRTPLHYSAALHDSGIFYRYLLKCGADENIQDKVSNIHFYLNVGNFLTVGQKFFFFKSRQKTREIK